MVCWAPQTAVAFYDNTIMDNFNFEYYNQTMFYYIMQEMMALSFLSHAYVSPLLILFISRKYEKKTFQTTGEYYYPLYYPFLIN